MSIEIDRITKVYTAADRTVEVLRDVSLQVASGSIFALRGANGAGKTTLLKILATLVLPTAGTARLCGIDIAADPARSRAVLGIAFDADRSFYQVLTLNDNLLFFGRLCGLAESPLRARIAELSGILDFSPWLREPVSHCSSGVRQKAAIARALLTEPQVLLIDELSRSLDAESVRSVSSFLRGYVREKNAACLVVTHDPSWPAEYADAQGVLEGGTVRREAAR